MYKKINVVRGENNPGENKDFTLNLQKAMLAALFECGKIDAKQHENAVRFLERNLSDSDCAAHFKVTEMN